MSEPTTPMPMPTDDETLVAYLDGELSPEETLRFEQNLYTEPGLQKRVNDMQASWSLLSELPCPSPRRDLTQSTIEMVTLAISQESRTWRDWFAEHRWLTLALAGASMLIAGAATSRALTHYMTRQILDNLPSIVDFPALQNIDSPEFLHELSQIDNLIAAAGPQAERAMIGDGCVPLSIDDRRRWVEQLKEDSRGRLESNLDEYRRPETQQETMRVIADEIYHDPSKTENYLQVIRAYNTILDRWGTKPRSTLQGYPLPKRIEAIRARVAVLMALSYVPSSQDRAAFRNWLDDIVQKQDGSEQLFYYYNYDAQRIVDELLWGDPDNSIVTHDDLTGLLQSDLSPEARERLIEIKDKSALRYHLGLWMAPLFAGTPVSGTNGNVDLQQRFYKLDERRQNELEFLPEEEVRKQLQQPTTPQPNSQSTSLPNSQPTTQPPPPVMPWSAVRQ
ncbi:MAG: hypothetical protein IT422_23660 [Pirellulaceae bacterium]|nr:hypothetical protein [Pirellulaceae bacterium]